MVTSWLAREVVSSVRNVALRSFKSSLMKIGWLCQMRRQTAQPPPDKAGERTHGPRVGATRGEPEGTRGCRPGALTGVPGLREVPAEADQRCRDGILLYTAAAHGSNGCPIWPLASNRWTIADAVREADLVIGGVLIPGASAPKLVRRAMISRMKPGAVVVDVAIDQGGCFETSHATTHTDPIYFADSVVHYCVSNMPAAVPHTSTFALTNATFPYLLELANKGLEKACDESPAVREGVNTYRGFVTHPGVAESQDRECTELAAAL